MTADPTTAAFGVDTLPYGVFSTRPTAAARRHPARRPRHRPRRDRRAPGHRLAEVLRQPSLNPLMASRPTDLARAARVGRESVAADADDARHLRGLTDVRLHLPFEVADYVDFYASESHASNVGKIFRPDSPALPASLEAPADRLPRPRRHRRRQRHRRRPAQRPAQARAPTGFRRSARACGSTSSARSASSSGSRAQLGIAVSIADAADHIFGVVLLNDWSARDIQAWEYVPLGPFLGKSFATSISAWVTPFDALDQARVPLPEPGPGGASLPAGDADVRLRARPRAHRPRSTAMVVSQAAAPRHVLVADPDARAHDGQRRVAARRRPVRVRHGQRRRPGSVRQPPRAELERHRAGRPGRRSRT